MRICFVSNELAEFHQNGGIGTATSGLVESMADAGHDVEVLYTGSVRKEDHREFRSAYVSQGYDQLRSRGVQVLFIEDYFDGRFLQSARRLSYAVFWFLRQREYEVIHFNDYGGNGYYTTLARRTGCAFAGTSIVTTIHGPTLWAMELDQEPVGDTNQLEQGFLEHTAIASSDCVVAVSQSLIDWLRGRNVTLPKNTRLLKNIHPDLPGLRTGGPIRPGVLKEVAFFGRMDERKGVASFVQAALRFAQNYPDVVISFYGKFSRLRGEHSAGYILHRLATLPNPLRFRTRFSREEALRALCRPGVLAVIPSRGENSPCVVVECQTIGIPFIASAVGGIPELIPPEYRDEVLVAPDPLSLAIRLEHIAEHGTDRSPTLRNKDEVAADWRRLFEELNNAEPVMPADVAAATPLVSVCITHYRRPQYLRRLLSAIEEQTYSNIEVILVDDGSNDASVDQLLAELSCTKFRFQLNVKRTNNSYLGAARNRAAEEARGIFIKFQDDDNIPLRHEIETLVRAAQHANAEVVTCFAYWMTGAEPKPIVDHNDIHYFPLGNAPVLGQLRNEFGDANALVRRDTFEALGGFTELRGIGQEDHEFFARCISSNRKLIVVPEPLFHYRIQPDSMLQTASVYDGYARAARGFAEIDSSHLHELAQLIVGQRVREEINSVGWHRAGKHSHGWLHQQLLEFDPNDPRTVDRVIDLMSQYGRVEDALFLSLDHKALHPAVEWMNTLGEAKLAEREANSGSTSLPIVYRLADRTSWELLTPRQADLPRHWNPDWPLVKVEHGGLLVHPVGSETTIARLPDAIPPRAKRVVVRWIHANPRGGAARIAATTTLDTGATINSWSQLDASDGFVDLVLDLDVVNTSQDLILMTRAVADDTEVWPVARLLVVECATTL